MYTGITQGLFKVVELKNEKNILTYTVQLNELLLQNLEIGASVSINGVCQTVVSIKNGCVEFQAIEETLQKTTLSSLLLGELVSVERSARIGTENGGHNMYGHIYGTATIVKIENTDNKFELVCECSKDMMQYLFMKGFVGVDGCSLTVHNINLENNTFTLSLIPHTLKVTNFPYKKIGDKVNIEVDATTVTIVETIKRLKL